MAAVEAKNLIGLLTQRPDGKARDTFLVCNREDPFQQCSSDVSVPEIWLHIDALNRDIGLIGSGRAANRRSCKAMLVWSVVIAFRLGLISPPTLACKLT